MIQTAVLFVYFAFECISVPLYVWIIYVLFRDATFYKLPFYRFLIIFGISNLLNYAITLFFYVLPMSAPTAQFYGQLPPSRWIAVVGSIVFYTSYQQDFLFVSISLNRLTAVWLPFKQKRIWNFWYRWHILFSLLAPIPLTIQYFTAIGIYFPLYDNPAANGYALFFTEISILELNVNLTTIYVNGFCLVTSLLANILTFLKIYKLKNGTANSASPEGGGGSGVISKMERNLSIISLVMTATLSSSMIFQLIIYFIPTWTSSDIFLTVYSQIPWINDLRVLSQPWLLLCLSEDIRKAAFPCADSIGKKKPLAWKTKVEILAAPKTTTQLKY